jgi:hypothetical protein
LLSPLAPLFLGIVITALTQPRSVGGHVFAHVLAVLPAAFLRCPVAVVFLCHAASLSPN